MRLGELPGARIAGVGAIIGRGERVHGAIGDASAWRGQCLVGVRIAIPVDEAGHEVVEWREHRSLALRE